MSSAITEEVLLEAIRTSSNATRIRILHEILMKGSGKNPPVISPEREAELQARLKNPGETRDLRDYIAKLSSPGGSS